MQDLCIMVLLCYFTFLALSYYKAIHSYFITGNCADIVTSMLLRKCGQLLHSSYRSNLQYLGIASSSQSPGSIAALTYLWNPLTIVSCVGLSTSSIDNSFVVLALYGACSGSASLAAIGWVMATHLSLYPVILVIPVILLLAYGPDSPPRKLFAIKNFKRTQNPNLYKITHFFCWSILCLLCVLTACHVSIKEHSNLWEMLRRTHGFILAVEDLSPNIGVLWYFFAEAFDFFRNFFLMVFHINILFMLLPLAIRINHRPFFLAFTYVAISSLLKSYPSVGDCALCLGLLALFSHQLADMQFSFFLSCGYVAVFLFSPVMHNLWIWRGTGNANFYFATAIGYACLEIMLVMDSVGTMLNHDRTLRKLVTAAIEVD